MNNRHIFNKIFKKNKKLLDRKVQSIKLFFYNMIFQKFLKLFNFDYLQNDRYLSFEYKGKKYLCYQCNNLHFGHQILELMQFYSLCLKYKKIPILNYTKKIKLDFIFKLEIEKLNPNIISPFFKKLIFLIYSLHGFLFKKYFLKSNRIRYFDRKLIFDCPKFVIPNEEQIKIEIFNKFPEIIGRKIITISVRNDNYYDYLKAPKAIKGSRDERVRNFNSNVYLKTIQKFHSEYFFVKIGYKDNDDILDQFGLNNYLDLSNRKGFDIRYQYFFVKNAFLSVNGDSGTIWFPKLFRVPSLNINCIHPILNFPIRENEFCVMQKVFKDNDLLDIDDFLSQEGLNNPKNPELFKYEPHTQNDFLYIFEKVIKRIKDNDYTHSNDENIIRLKIKKTINLLSNANRKSINYSSYMLKWSDEKFNGNGIFLKDNLLN